MTTTQKSIKAVTTIAKLIATTVYFLTGAILVFAGGAASILYALFYQQRVYNVSEAEVSLEMFQHFFIGAALPFMVWILLVFVWSFVIPDINVIRRFLLY